MRGTAVAAGIAHGWAWVVSLWFAFWPRVYTGVEGQPQVVQPHVVPPGVVVTPEIALVTQTVHRSLIEVNGPDVLLILLVPVALTGVGLWASLQDEVEAGPWTKGVHWGAAVLLLAACVVAVWSLGLFYLPAAIALVASAALSLGRGRKT